MTAGTATLAQNSPPAQGTRPSDQSQPVFRGGVNYIRVDVTVTDGTGKAIQDLKPDDFEVLEAGKVQKIETFKLVSLDGGLMSTRDDDVLPIRTEAQEAREAARDDVRLFGIFLDDYHVRRISSVGMRDQLATFIQTQLGPSDMVGVMYPLEPITAVRMTRDHDAIRRALLAFEGRKYSYWPTSEVERYVFTESSATVERIRNDVSFRAIKSLIVRLGVLKEGRKSLILISEGFNSGLPFEMSSFHGGLGTGGLVDGFPGGGGIGNQMPLTLSMMQPPMMSLDLQEIYDLANRNNVAIYPVDPRRLVLTEFGFDVPTVADAIDKAYLTRSTDTLRILAENTDGRAVIGRNDIAIAMKQIVVDASAYYLLGYNSNVAVNDGKFHELRVRVKRPGLEVRHRQGYWAFTSDDAAKVNSPAPRVGPSVIETALAATVTPAGRAVRSWIGNERGDLGRTRLTFVWEPIPPRRPVPEMDQPARVTISASGSDGAPIFSGRTPDGRSGGHLAFDVPPGTLQLRIAVESVSGEVIDSELRGMVVPDLSMPRPAIATPRLYHARTLAELQRLKSEKGAVPTASTDFRRTEHLLVRVPIYAPGAAAPILAAQLVNREGQKMSDLPVSMAVDTYSSAQIEVPLAPLAAGSYGVRLTATSAGESVSQVVAFRVVP